MMRTIVEACRTELEVVQEDVVDAIRICKCLRNRLNDAMKALSMVLLVNAPKAASTGSVAHFTPLLSMVKRHQAG